MGWLDFLYEDAKRLNLSLCSKSIVRIDFHGDITTSCF
jgi:hypothetical protein